MDMGAKIKSRRLELNMTQEELAEKLNVSRSTVSNWEIGRNYPDLQLIVSLADILDLSLDEMLREDCQMIKRIAEDTKCRKRQSWKIRILVLLLILVCMAAVMYVIRPVASFELRNPEQIVSVTRTGDMVNIVTDIPKYRSISTWYMDSSPGGNAVHVSIGMSLDLSMKNNETIDIELVEEFKDINKISFVHDGEAFKTVELK